MKVQWNASNYWEIETIRLKLQSFSGKSVLVSVKRCFNNIKT